MKTLLILGISSLTGSKLSQLCKNDFKIFGTYNLRKPKISNTNLFHFDVFKDNLNDLFEEIRPNFVVNSIAINGVDFCEKNRNISQHVNSDFVLELTKLCEKYDVKLIHLSSDSVFNGNQIAPYSESDNPNPINFYGQTKFEAEKHVLSNRKNLVIRVSVLYGHLFSFLQNLESSSMKPTNFGLWFVKQLEQGKSVKIIIDEFSSPILVNDFAKAILFSLKNDLIGLFHAGPSCSISRYDFCYKIAKQFNYDTSLIIPTTREQLGRDVLTAKNKALNSLKFEKMGFHFENLDNSINIFYKDVIKNE